MTVSAVLGQLAAGLTFPELLVDFPYLDRADVLASLEFAAGAVQERELPIAQGALPPCVSLLAPTCRRRLPFLAFASRVAVVKVGIDVGSTFTPCVPGQSDGGAPGRVLAVQSAKRVWGVPLGLPESGVVGTWFGAGSPDRPVERRRAWCGAGEYAPDLPRGYGRRGLGYLGVRSAMTTA